MLAQADEAMSKLKGFLKMPSFRKKAPTPPTDDTTLTATTSDVNGHTTESGTYPQLTDNTNTSGTYPLSEPTNETSAGLMSLADDKHDKRKLSASSKKPGKQSGSSKAPAPPPASAANSGPGDTTDSSNPYPYSYPSWPPVSSEPAAPPRRPHEPAEPQPYKPPVVHSKKSSSRAPDPGTWSPLCFNSFARGLLRLSHFDPKPAAFCSSSGLTRVV